MGIGFASEAAQYYVWKLPLSDFISIIVVVIAFGGVLVSILLNRKALNHQTNISIFDKRIELLLYFINFYSSKNISTNEFNNEYTLKMFQLRVLFKDDYKSLHTACSVGRAFYTGDYHGVVENSPSHVLDEIKRKHKSYAFLYICKSEEVILTYIDGCINSLLNKVSNSIYG